jgi:hypothetical protein
MLTVMWNPYGLHVIDRLLAGAKINSIYDTTNSLQSLHQGFFSHGRNPHAKRLIAHFDKWAVHRSMTAESFMKTRDMVSMPHSPYSPDLAPNDFYLSPTVKERLEYAEITDEDSISEELYTILR